MLHLALGDQNVECSDHYGCDLVLDVRVPLWSFQDRLDGQSERCYCFRL